MKTDQVGALCVRRRRNGGYQVLLITSRDRGRWIIPKGWRTKRLKDHKAAAREAKEEAGVSGEVRQKPIGTYAYPKIVDAGKRSLRWRCSSSMCVNSATIGRSAGSAGGPGSISALRSRRSRSRRCELCSKASALSRRDHAGPAHAGEFTTNPFFAVVIGDRRAGERSERPARPLNKCARRTLARSGLVGARHFLAAIETIPSARIGSKAPLVGNRTQRCCVTARDTHAGSLLQPRWKSIRWRGRCGLR